MKVNLVLLLGFSLFALSAGAPNCSSPCADLWVAKECRQVQHCIENEWSKLKPTGKTDDVCDICLRMVQEAKTTLESNETETALKQVLEGSCSLLVLKPAIELCDKLADELVPQLVAILASQMDPETVCTVAKLCNNDVLRALQKKSKDCTECRKFMACSKETMKTVSEGEFQDALVSLCRNTGSFSDACYGISLTHSNLLFNHTKKALNVRPCEATFLCPSSSAAEAATYETLSPSTLSRLRKRMCPMCMRVTENIIGRLTRMKSLEDYHENFHKICMKLNFPNDFCSNSAKSSRMYDFLKENGKGISRFFCQKTICSEKRMEEIPFWPLLPVEHFAMSIEDVEDMILKSLVDFIREDGEQRLCEDMQREESGEESSEKKKPVDCQTCKSTLEKLTENEEKYDTSGASVHLCNNFSKESQDRCRDIIRTHEDEVKKVIAQHSSPHDACMKMNYCSPEVTGPSFKSISYGDPIENPMFFAPAIVNPFYESECTICKELSRVLSNYVNSSNSYMKQALGVACLMSSNLGKCSNFLESYSPDIARAFTEYVSSEKVCQDVIPSCEPKQTYAVPKRESSQMCGTCKIWVEGVTNVLLDDRNMEMIKATFALGCDKFPREYQDQCRLAMDRNSEEKLATILQHLSPDAACENLNYCLRNEDESAVVATTLSPVIVPAKEIPNRIKVSCTFCLLLMKSLVDQLESDKTEEAIRNALKNFCKYFPEQVRPTCRNFIDQYSEDIIDMIIADFNPTEICIRLQMCDPNTTLSDANTTAIHVFDIGTNEIHGEESPKQISEYFSSQPEVDQALLQRLHLDVQECAMCGALVQVITTHKKMLVKGYDFFGNSSVICRIVPRHKRKQCMSMIVSYGPSIVNLLVDKKVEPNDVCLELTLCDSSMHARVDMPVSVPEPKPSVSVSSECHKGPSFWCANEENAKKCGTFLHCREVVWNTENPPK